MNNTTHQLISINGNKVWATPSEQATIETLKATRAGGCASVIGYQPTSNWEVTPTQNIQFLSRVSTEKLYKRRQTALNALTMSDIANHISSDVKLAALSHSALVDIFETRRDMEAASIQKSLDGNNDDAHRQGHVRCYIKITEGIKVNLVTQKDEDNLKQPVLNNGFPMVASIMVSALFLNVTTTVEGKRKVVNSGTPVRMSNIIKKALSQTGLNLKMLSLKPDNFEMVKIDHNVILAEELHDLAA